ncbi:MAG: cation transporter [Kiritimatiellae bacterium]|nr:cation transporter [Kiritimatiellia bacterium]
MTLEERAKRAVRITAEGVIVNVVLMLLNFAAAIFGHSQAMMADAIHTLSDFLSDIVVYIGVQMGKKPRDADHDYGHGKYEQLAAMVIGLILMGVGAKIGWNAIGSHFDALNGHPPRQPGMIAFWVSLLSVLAKEILFRRTLIVGKVIGNDAIVANAWHHCSDALSSIGSALGIGAAAILGKSWGVMDPIAAIGVSLLLIYAASGIVREQLGSLTERSLSEELENEIIRMVTDIDGVSHPHNLRTRKVGSLVVIDLHLRVNPDMRVQEAHDRVSLLEERLRKRFGENTIATIHIEPEHRQPDPLR